VVVGREALYSPDACAGVCGEAVFTLELEVLQWSDLPA